MENYPGSRLGWGLRNAREELGLTQGDVIREIRRQGKEVERNYLSTLENGKVKHPRIEKLDFILTAMKLDAASFILYVQWDCKVSIKLIQKKLIECYKEFMGSERSGDKDLDFITSKSD